MLAQEYYEEDFHDIASVAGSERGISTLHEATGGEPARSARWHANMEMGGDQELLVALRTQPGEAWGFGLYREPGAPQFDAEELAFLREVSGRLAKGAQRGLLVGEASDPEGPDAPGLVVLRDDWSVESVTPGHRALARRAARRRLGGPEHAAAVGAGGGRPGVADRRAP